MCTMKKKTYFILLKGVSSFKDTTHLEQLISKKIACNDACIDLL